MMQRLFVIGLTLTSLLAAIGFSSGNEETGKNWALLVAGSFEWGNYRHQAGVCHAYQVLRDHGFDEENIIVMMYDDIAYNSKNPTPGVIINKPGGPNVYEGVAKDYTGYDVTMQNFLMVLMGDEKGMYGVGSGKVIKSGPEDRIFVNMVDSGRPGLFLFPDNPLYGIDLRDVVELMHEQGKFKEMMMYVESSMSGSMFEGFYPDDIGVYSTTAADESGHSYATYFDEELNTYLGDLYGVCWMEDADGRDLNQQTLGEQYQVIKVCNEDGNSKWYGQPSIQNETVATFMGTGTSLLRGASSGKESLPRPGEDAVIGMDVPLAILKKKLEKATDDQKTLINEEISSFLERREFVRETTKEIASLVTGDAELAEEFMQRGSRKITNWTCYKSAVDAFSNKCFHLSRNPYALSMVTTILNLCESGFESKDIISAIESVCTFGTVTGIQ